MTPYLILLWGTLGGKSYSTILKEGDLHELER